MNEGKVKSSSTSSCFILWILQFLRTSKKKKITKQTPVLTYESSEHAQCCLDPTWIIKSCLFIFLPQGWGGDKCQGVPFWMKNTVLKIYFHFIMCKLLIWWILCVCEKLVVTVSTQPAQWEHLPPKRRMFIWHIHPNLPSYMEFLAIHLEIISIWALFPHVWGWKWLTGTNNCNWCSIERTQYSDNNSFIWMWKQDPDWKNTIILL